MSSDNTALLRSCGVALTLFALSGCDALSDLNDLEVDNQNDPDRERVLAEAQDVETLVGGAFLTWLDATHGVNPSLALSATADEGTMSWFNWNTYLMSQEPREPWPNDPLFEGGAIGVAWRGNYEALSSVYDGLVILAADDGALASAIDVGRARAFGRFVQGLAHGYLALLFDSAYVFDETVDLEEDAIVRVPYPDVMQAALGYLDEAIALASGASWSLDPQWIRGNQFSAGEFVGLVHGFKARYLSQVAREPSEREALDWPSIMSEVDRNLGTDFSFEGDGVSQGVWFHAMQWMVGSRWFLRADYKTIGYTDTGGGYASWLQRAVDQRDEFLLLTPDARVTGDPSDGTVDGTDFVYTGASPYPRERGTYHHSQYRSGRYRDYRESGGFGRALMMSDAVQQLIKAEGLLRTGDGDGAAAIVNLTRVGRGGLPPATGTDADLMDKLFYEMSIENYAVCGGCAFFNRRGWGPLVDTRGSPPGTHHWGLVAGTPRHFAMPGDQLQLLEQAIYTYGGVGNEGGALAPAGAAGAAGAARPNAAPAWAIYSFTGLHTVREKLAYIEGKRRREGELPHR